MQSIDNIMKLRKGYAIKLYEYFNHVQGQNKLDEQINLIQSEANELFQEEHAIWNKLKENKNTLDKFDKEIATLSESKGVLDKKRLSEVKNLRQKLELKYKETEEEYNLYLKNVEDIQNKWKNSLETFLLNGAQKQKILIKLHNAVHSTYGDLKEYCSEWKNEPIKRLQTIIKEAKQIEESAMSVIIEIKGLSLLNMDQQYLLDQKTKEIPKSCELLSKKLELFITNLDYLDILEKTKDTDPFVTEFFSIFKDTGFTSLRTSIRMVNNLSTTEKKMVTIVENFQHIQIIFNQVLDKLYLKKEEIMAVCIDAEDFAKTTLKKWITTNYNSILNITEQIRQKRNEFVVNETIF